MKDIIQVKDIIQQDDINIVNNYIMRDQNT